MPGINIIGCGPGNTELLTAEAKKAVERSCCLIGDKRMLVPYENSGKQIFHSGSPEEIIRYLEAVGHNEEVAVLVSGDVGFYSLTKKLLETVKNQIKLFCGIGSMQYFCSKLKTSWEDVVPVSLHGRDVSIPGPIMYNEKVFILTGGKNTPQSICRTLCEYGLGSLTVSVGENLSYEQERITTASASVIAEKSFEALSVILVQNSQPSGNNVVTHGLPDEIFIRGEVPMTKQEVRSVSLSKLQLRSTDIVYDIGAGTGSVAVEMALQVRNGRVYALEKDPEAILLIKKNREKFGTANLKVIEALAPEGLQALPAPNRVFIGGSSGNLTDILNAVYEKNQETRVVINAITLETLNEAVYYYSSREAYEAEITNISVSRAAKIGNYHLMKAQNPVYIITATRKT